MDDKQFTLLVKLIENLDKKLDDFKLESRAELHDFKLETRSKFEQAEKNREIDNNRIIDAIKEEKRSRQKMEDKLEKVITERELIYQLIFNAILSAIVAFIVSFFTK